MKYKVIFLFIFISLFIFSCSNNENTTNENYHYQPEIITLPTADNLLLGNPLKEANISGEFNVDGTLTFEFPDYIPTNVGEYQTKWVFNPVDSNYDTLTGNIVVQIYEHKISFIENGGFEINDVFFNDEYVIDSMPLTAKNEYHFDGWSLAEDSLDYIDFPYKVDTTVQLYACYRLHTAEKIIYQSDYDIDENGEKVYFYHAIGDKSNQVNSAIPSYNEPITEPIEGSIEGEVIIADMYNGIPVTSIHGFEGSKITNIVFSNYIENLGGLAYCLNYDFTYFEIPETVKVLNNNTFTGTNIKNVYISKNMIDISSAFIGCDYLTNVKFEDRVLDINLKSAFEYCKNLKSLDIPNSSNISSIAYCCYNLEKVTFSNELKIIGESAFGQCYSLESITIPSSVDEIGNMAFVGCENLNDVVFENDNLQIIHNGAFSHCYSLKELEIPKNALVYPNAFRETPIENIDISDNQIEMIAKFLHEIYIGDASNFKVNIERDSKYSGYNLSGEYIATTEEINLRFDKFSINALDALIHEFFHHYQFVLQYGVDSEDFNSVPYYVDFFTMNAWTSNIPCIIVDNEYLSSIELNDLKSILVEESHKYLYNTPYILINSEYIEKYWSSYISLLPDNSNYNEYWNQAYEKDARTFAEFFTGVNYE